MWVCTILSASPLVLKMNIVNLALALLLWRLNTSRELRNTRANGVLCETSLNEIFITLPDHTSLRQPQLKSSVVKLSKSFVCSQPTCSTSYRVVKTRNEARYNVGFFASMLFGNPPNATSHIPYMSNPCNGPLPNRIATYDLQNVDPGAVDTACMLLEVIFIRNGSFRSNFSYFEDDAQFLISHLSSVWFYLLTFIVLRVRFYSKYIFLGEVSTWYCRY